MFREIFVEECYTPFGLEGSRDAWTVVDAGMNLGLFCIFLNSRGVRGTCLAFEPAPETYTFAVRNMRDCGIEVIEHGAELPKTPAASERLPDGLVVHAFQLALGSRHFGQQATFRFYPQTSANSAFADLQVDDSLEGAEVETMEVTCCQLSEALGAVFGEGGATASRAVDLLKVDVEGAEQEVFDGLAPKDIAQLRNLAVETSEETAVSLTTVLEDAGYRGELSVVDHPECRGQWLLRGHVAGSRQ